MHSTASVRQNAQTLLITFAIDMVVSLLGAAPIFDTQWAFLAIFLLSTTSLSMLSKGCWHSR
jgi:hypothetical protein